MTRSVYRSLGVVLVLAACARAETPSADVKAAMDEMWRRGHCLLSSVLKPAAKEAAVPRGLGTTPVLRPRLRAARGRLLCYAVDGAVLWAADDQALYRVDAAAGKLLKRYDLADGLPDSAIQSIAPAGKALWLATRTGLARLDTQTGRCTRVKDIRFGAGRLAAGPSGVWLVSDAGVYRLAPGQTAWRKRPDTPALKALAAAARRGFWWGRWPVQLRAWVPQVFVTGDGMVAIVLGRLLHYPASGGPGRQVGERAWHAAVQGRTVWALTTGGLIRYDAAAGKTERFTAGKALPTGRPTALAVSDSALVVATEADYDKKTKRFAGGGIGRLDLATGTWTVTTKVADTDVRFVTALLADGNEAWAACTLYDRVVQLGAHPGMAHIKRYRPHVAGLALLHFDGTAWRVMPLAKHKPDRRWVLGQKGTKDIDNIVPKRFDGLYRSGPGLWGVVRMVPDRYYSGYYISAGMLAERTGGRWAGRFDIRTGQLDLVGPQPKLMLISHSHGERLVLADGHPRVLGIVSAGGRTWAVCESGLFVRDAGTGAFAPVVRATRRAYWRVTAAAAGKHAVWFGGDAGTVSRLDRKTGRLELLGVAKGRKVTAIAVVGDLGADDAVLARTAGTKAVLPASLAKAPRLPALEAIAYNGTTWYARDEAVRAPRRAFATKKRGSTLYRGNSRAAFVQGVFRPIVLCEDRTAGVLWLGTYSGVASVPLPGR